MHKQHTPLAEKSEGNNQISYNQKQYSFWNKTTGTYLDDIGLKASWENNPVNWRYDTIQSNIQEQKQTSPKHSISYEGNVSLQVKDGRKKTADYEVIDISPDLKRAY